MPYLIALTPRAGRWNHRLLIGDKQYRHLDLYGLANKARQHPEGSTWLAVSKKVEQKDYQRQGDEILILAGVDVTKLEQAKVQSILNDLRKILDGELNELIEFKINWEQEGKQDPVVIHDLSEWVKAYNFHLLPESQSRNLSMNRFFEKNTNLVLIIGVGIFMVTTVFLSLNWISFSEKGQFVQIPEKLCEVFGKCEIREEDYLKLCKIYALSKEDCFVGLSGLDSTDLENLGNIYKNLNYDKSQDNIIPFSDAVCDSKEIEREVFPKKLDRAKYITPDNFKELREYKKKIKRARIALTNFGYSQPFMSDSEDVKWSEREYDQALKNLREFVNNSDIVISERKDLAYVFYKQNFFERVCKIKDDLPLSKKIKDGCNSENDEWKRLREDQKVKEAMKDENSEVYKFISLYEAIMDLKPPSI